MVGESFGLAAVVGGHGEAAHGTLAANHKGDELVVVLGHGAHHHARHQEAPQRGAHDGRGLVALVQLLDARARRYRKGTHLAVGRRSAHNVVAETNRLSVEVDDAALARGLLAVLVCHVFLSSRLLGTMVAKRDEQQPQREARRRPAQPGFRLAAVIVQTLMWQRLHANSGSFRTKSSLEKPQNVRFLPDSARGAEWTAARKPRSPGDPNRSASDLTRARHQQPQPAR